jgi:hypothetical protein
MMPQPPADELQQRLMQIGVIALGMLPHRDRGDLVHCAALPEGGGHVCCGPDTALPPVALRLESRRS